MTHRIQLVVEVDAPPPRVWAAFTDSALRSQWEANQYEIDARPGGRYQWSFPGAESHGTVVDCQPQQRLVQQEQGGGHTPARQTFLFEPAPSGGTRLELLHEGLPSEEIAKSVELAWQQAFADLIVLLVHGVPANRFLHSMQHVGLWPSDRPEGLIVASVDEDGIAAVARVRPGDLLLAIAGTPVFTRPELWFAMRAAQPGQRVPVQYVRAGNRCETHLQIR